MANHEAERQRLLGVAWADVQELRTEVARFKAVARRILAVHDSGDVTIMQEDADELRELLREDA